jgi:hypothetical protein
MLKLHEIFQTAEASAVVLEVAPVCYERLICKTDTNDGTSS